MSTINAVASLAKVSVSTVSRVMNDQPGVSPETAEAVRKAMKELSYAPSERRPGPKSRGREVVDVVNVAFLVFGAAQSRTTPAFDGLLNGVSFASTQSDLNLFVSHLPQANALPARLFERKIEGVLLHGIAPSVEIQEQLKQFPAVWLMGNRHRPTFGDRVMPDGYMIGEIAARYLIDRGHERLAFLNMDTGHWPYGVYGHAFELTAAEEGRSVQMVALGGRATTGYQRQADPDAVRAVVDAYLALPDRPTGLFVADDMQVASLQPALQARGVEIGEGAVEIISCNNEIPLLSGLSPKPATIDIHIADIGRRGVEQLIWRMKNADNPQRITQSIAASLVPSIT